MVVDDHVAVLDLASSRQRKPRMYQGSEPMCIGVESDSQSSRPCGVEDAGAEVLGLADDRRVAHPEEHAGHLLGDRVERAAEHAQGDRVDLDALARRRPGLPADLVLDDAHARATSLLPSRPERAPDGCFDDDVPKRSTCAAKPGRDHRRRVVLVDDRRALRAGCPPSARRGRSSASAPAPGRRPRGTTPRARGGAPPFGRVGSPCSASGVESGGISPIPRTRMFGISMSDSSKRREYSRSWMSWKSCRTFSAQSWSIAPESTSTRSSYPCPR